MGTGLKVATFQQRFAQLFEESEKTTTALAKELHISNQTVSAWKIGTRSPKEPTIIAIAKYFGVNVPWLMGFDVEKAAPRNDAIAIPDTEMFRKLMENMSYEDLVLVTDAFRRTEQKMREEGKL